MAEGVLASLEKEFRALLAPKLLAEAKAVQVVWARVKGYPAWPAQVLTEAVALRRKDLGQERHSKGNSVPVMFFGTVEVAWVKDADVIDFKEGLHQGFFDRKTKPFKLALEQVCEYLALDRKRKAPPKWWCKPPSNGLDDQLDGVAQKPSSASGSGAAKGSGQRQDAAKGSRQRAATPATDTSDTSSSEEDEEEDDGPAAQQAGKKGTSKLSSGKAPSGGKAKEPVVPSAVRVRESASVRPPRENGSTAASTTAAAQTQAKKPPPAPSAAGNRQQPAAKAHAPDAGKDAKESRNPFHTATSGAKLTSPAEAPQQHKAPRATAPLTTVCHAAAAKENDAALPPRKRLKVEAPHQGSAGPAAGTASSVPLPPPPPGVKRTASHDDISGLEALAVNELDVCKLPAEIRRLAGIRLPAVPKKPGAKVEESPREIGIKVEQGAAASTAVGPPVATCAVPNVKCEGAGTADVRELRSGRGGAASGTRGSAARHGKRSRRSRSETEDEAPLTSSGSDAEDDDEGQSSGEEADSEAAASSSQSGDGSDDSSDEDDDVPSARKGPKSAGDEARGRLARPQRQPQLVRDRRGEKQRRLARLAAPEPADRRTSSRLVPKACGKAAPAPSKKPVREDTSKEEDSGSDDDDDEDVEVDDDEEQDATSSASSSSGSDNESEDEPTGKESGNGSDGGRRLRSGTTRPEGTRTNPPRRGTAPSLRKPPPGPPAPGPSRESSQPADQRAKATSAATGATRETSEPDATQKQQRGEREGSGQAPAPAKAVPLELRRLQNSPSGTPRLVDTSEPRTLRDRSSPARRVIGSAGVTPTQTGLTATTASKRVEKCASEDGSEASMSPGAAREHALERTKSPERWQQGQKGSAAGEPKVVPKAGRAQALEGRCSKAGVAVGSASPPPAPVTGGVPVRKKPPSLGVPNHGRSEGQACVRQLPAIVPARPVLRSLTSKRDAIPTSTLSSGTSAGTSAAGAVAPMAVCVPKKPSAGPPTTRRTLDPGPDVPVSSVDLPGVAAVDCEADAKHASSPDIAAATAGTACDGHVPRSPEAASVDDIVDTLAGPGAVEPQAIVVERVTAATEDGTATAGQLEAAVEPCVVAIEHGSVAAEGGTVAADGTAAAEEPGGAVVQVPTNAEARPVDVEQGPVALEQEPRVVEGQESQAKLPTPKQTQQEEQEEAVEHRKATDEPTSRPQEMDVGASSAPCPDAEVVQPAAAADFAQEQAAAPGAGALHAMDIDVQPVSEPEVLPAPERAQLSRCGSLGGPPGMEQVPQPPEATAPPQCVAPPDAQAPERARSSSPEHELRQAQPVPAEEQPALTEEPRVAPKSSCGPALVDQEAALLAEEQLPDQNEDRGPLASCSHVLGGAPCAVIAEFQQLATVLSCERPGAPPAPLAAEATARPSFAGNDAPADVRPMEAIGAGAGGTGAVAGAEVATAAASTGRCDSGNGSAAVDDDAAARERARELEELGEVAAALAGLQRAEVLPRPLAAHPSPPITEPPTERVRSRSARGPAGRERSSGVLDGGAEQAAGTLQGFKWPQPEPLLPAQDQPFALPHDWLLTRPPRYEPVKRNMWLSRAKPKRLPKDEISICACRPPPVVAPGELQRMGCDGNCLNRLSSILCDPKLCPCGELCRNRPLHLLRQPKTEPFLTENRGWGVRAIEPIYKGSFIIEYAGEVIDERELGRRMEHARMNGEPHFYIMELSAGLYIDARRKGNVARLINSSCEPNCETQKWHDAATGEVRVGIFATRDILPGEELVYDYFFSTYGALKPSAASFVCMCGSKNCRGTMDLHPEKRRDLGRRIEVFWDADGQYYRAVIVAYHPTSRKHTVMYEDGGTEKLSLDEVPHRWLDVDPSKSSPAKPAEAPGMEGASAPQPPATQAQQRPQDQPLAQGQALECAPEGNHQQQRQDAGAAVQLGGDRARYGSVPVAVAQPPPRTVVPLEQRCALPPLGSSTTDGSGQNHGVLGKHGLQEGELQLPLKKRQRMIQQTPNQPQQQQPAPPSSALADPSGRLAGTAYGAPHPQGSSGSGDGITGAPAGHSSGGGADSGGCDANTLQGRASIRQELSGTGSGRVCSGGATDDANDDLDSLLEAAEAVAALRTAPINKPPPAAALSPASDTSLPLQPRHVRSGPPSGTVAMVQTTKVASPRHLVAAHRSGPPNGLPPHGGGSAGRSAGAANPHASSSSSGLVPHPSTSKQHHSPWGGAQQASVQQNDGEYYGRNGRSCGEADGGASGRMATSNGYGHDNGSNGGINREDLLWRLVGIERPKDLLPLFAGGSEKPRNGARQNGGAWIAPSHPYGKLLRALEASELLPHADNLRLYAQQQAHQNHYQQHQQPHTQQHQARTPSQQLAQPQQQQQPQPHQAFAQPVQAQPQPAQPQAPPQQPAQQQPSVPTSATAAVEALAAWQHAAQHQVHQQLAQHVAAQQPAVQASSYIGHGHGLEAGAASMAVLLHAQQQHAAAAAAAVAAASSGQLHHVLQGQATAGAVAAPAAAAGSLPSQALGPQQLAAAAAAAHWHQAAHMQQHGQILQDLVQMYVTQHAAAPHPILGVAGTAAVAGRT